MFSWKTLWNGTYLVARKGHLVWCGGMVLGLILLCGPCRNNEEWQIFRQENLQVNYVRGCILEGTKKQKTESNEILTLRLYVAKLEIWNFIEISLIFLKRFLVGIWWEWFSNVIFQRSEMPNVLQSHQWWCFSGKCWHFFTWTSLILGEYFIPQKLSQTQPTLHTYSQKESRRLRGTFLAEQMEFRITGALGAGWEGECVQELLWSEM